MNTRSRSQSNVGKIIEAFANKQGKRSKKRISDVGPAKARATRRNTRCALIDISNNQVDTKRVKVKKGNLKKKSDTGPFRPQDSRQGPIPLPSTNAGNDNLQRKSGCCQSISEFVDFDVTNESDIGVPMKDESDCEDEKREMKKEIDEILKIDAADLHNPQAVTEYIQDIMIYFRSTEGLRSPRSHYMETQKDINSKMREILIDWLSEVHLKFKLRPETMYLTVNLIDRFLSLRMVPRTKLQLVGCTAMLVASKYEEIYAPEVRDFVYISDKAYTRDQILMMESIMLNTLQFNLTVPSALRFAQRYIKLAIGVDKRFKTLVEYLTELTLQNYNFLLYLPSKIASSAVYLALSMVSGKPRESIWTQLLRSQTNYDEEQLSACVRDLQSLASKNPEKYRAVRKKYSSRRFHEVAKIPVGSPLFQ